MPLDVLVDGFSHRFGGGVAYLAGLLPALARQPAVRRVQLIVEPDSALAARLAGSPVELDEVRLRPPGSLISRAIWESTALPGRAEGTVVIAPAAMLPRRPGAPVVAVPHNALPFEAGGARNAVQLRAIGRTLAWSSGAIFVTEHMRQIVARRYPIPPVNGVVHHGVADVFFDGVATTPPRHDIVCIADAYPHKRLGLLLSAWRLLGADRPPLRFIGRGVAEFIEPEHGVTFQEGLTTAEVAQTLRATRLVVLPSARESFGLPALEALATGTPLVVSDIPAYREITGGHATLVAGDSAEMWAAAMRLALGSALSSERARTWARQFTWERCADRTVSILERAAART